jgi:hypothetical protein
VASFGFADASGVNSSFSTAMAVTALSPATGSVFGGTRLLINVTASLDMRGTSFRVLLSTAGPLHTLRRADLQSNRVADCDVVQDSVVASSSFECVVTFRGAGAALSGSSYVPYVYIVGAASGPWLLAVNPDVTFSPDVVMTVDDVVVVDAWNLELTIAGPAAADLLVYAGTVQCVVTTNTHNSTDFESAVSCTLDAELTAVPLPLSVTASSGIVLCTRQVATLLVLSGLSPATGSVSGGGVLAISGLGLPSSCDDVFVFFGTVPARCVNASALQVQVVVPRYYNACALACTVGVTVSLGAADAVGRASTVTATLPTVYVYNASVGPSIGRIATQVDSSLRVHVLIFGSRFTTNAFVSVCGDVCDVDMLQSNASFIACELEVRFSSICVLVTPPHDAAACAQGEVPRICGVEVCEPSVGCSPPAFLNGMPLQVQCNSAGTTIAVTVRNRAYVPNAGLVGDTLAWQHRRRHLSASGWLWVFCAQ